MKTRVLFRADGGIKTGLGHVIRSLALADMLAGNFHRTFIIQNPDKYTRNEISRFCEDIIEVEENRKYEKEADLIAKTYCTKTDFFVLDGYNFDIAYQHTIRSAVSKLICIDDIHSIPFDADGIINHTFGITRKDYVAPPLTDFFLGSQYLLLRKPFIEAASEEKNADSVSNAFISLGGSDPLNFTLEALQHCLKSTIIKEIDVVVGTFYMHVESLEAFAKAQKNATVNIHINVSAEEMSRLMKNSDIGICSASSVAYEYCCAGKLLFLYQTADNQQYLYRFLVAETLAYPMDELDRIIFSWNEENMQIYLHRKKLFFNGTSADRLKKIFLDYQKEDALFIRKAVSEDVMLYFEWANDPDVRNNAVSTKPILLEKHKKWFSARVASAETVLYVVENEKKPIGQVRFDIKEAHVSIDYSLDKKFRGQGYGKPMLKKAIRQLYDMDSRSKPLHAIVKEENLSSARIFEQLGFNKLTDIFIDGGRYRTFELVYKNSPGINPHKQP